MKLRYFRLSSREGEILYPERLPDDHVRVPGSRLWNPRRSSYFTAVSSGLFDSLKHYQPIPYDEDCPASHERITKRLRELADPGGPKGGIRARWFRVNDEGGIIRTDRLPEEFHCNRDQTFYDGRRNGEFVQVESPKFDIVPNGGLVPFDEDFAEANAAPDPLAEIMAERHEEYGDAKETQRFIAMAWASKLQPHAEAVAKGEPVPEWVVALMFNDAKSVRMRLKFKQDNFDDAHNYLKFAEQWQKEDHADE